MSESFLSAVNARAVDCLQHLDNDDAKYKRIAEDMVIEGNAYVLAQVLRQLAEEGIVVQEDGPFVNVGGHTFIPCG